MSIETISVNRGEHLISPFLTERLVAVLNYSDLKTGDLNLMARALDNYGLLIKGSISSYNDKYKGEELIEKAQGLLGIAIATGYMKGIFDKSGGISRSFMINHHYDLGFTEKEALGSALKTYIGKGKPKDEARINHILTLIKVGRFH